MATIDFSAATVSFDITSPQNVDHHSPSSYSPVHYAWTTGSGYTVTALSAIGAITSDGSAPTGGTISAINARAGGDRLFAITGLNASLPSLVSTADVTLSHERFWETVLSGATTFIMPQQTGVITTVFGDFVTVNAGQISHGAGDLFSGVGSSDLHTAMGDALLVAATAKLAGGADRFVDLSGEMIGDAGSNLGTLKGGNDKFIAHGDPLGSTIDITSAVGDALDNASSITGGADTFSFVNVGRADYIVGDVLSHGAGSVIGGDDRIVIARSGGFTDVTEIISIVGDVRDVSAGATTEGGNDTLSIKDADVSIISGDVVGSAGDVIGGNDRIDFASSAPFYSGPPQDAPSLASVARLTGDAYEITGGRLIGGSDLITMTNGYAGAIYGDVVSLSEAQGKGGNDTIRVSWDQVNRPLLKVAVVGDCGTLTDGAFTGGNDTIIINLTIPNPGQALLTGDGYAVEGLTAFTGGDDTIVLNSNRVDGQAILVGDAHTVDGGPFTGGDDTLTGSNGADFIYGDVVTFGTGALTGGDDVLNGRGGNDLLDGGSGFDTAVYSSLDQAVYVDLNGIAGTAPAGGDLVEAIGQGWDQLTGIEAVTGSRLGDTIVGDAEDNLFSGLGGNDTLNGGTGADRLVGGQGDDTYVTDGGDTIVEQADQGSDTVRSSATLALGANLENLTLTGANAIDGAGNGLANIIVGNAAANVLKGAGGNDRLYGGRGNDRPEGDAGNDVFVFDTSLNAATNLDTVADFANAAGNNDTIGLDNNVFAKLGAAGALNADFFRAGSAAADADDYLVYDPSTGALFYDADGNGAGAAVQFATLASRPALTTGDFVVI